MSSENPLKGRLAKRQNALEGELVTSTEEDPRVNRKFDELPAPVAEYWRRMPLEARRLVMNDERIINMPAEEMVRIFVSANPEYRTNEEILASLDKLAEPSTEETDPFLLTKDITPGKDVAPRIEHEDAEKISAIKKRLGIS